MGWLTILIFFSKYNDETESAMFVREFTTDGECTRMKLCLCTRIFFANGVSDGWLKRDLSVVFSGHSAGIKVWGIEPKRIRRSRSVPMCSS